MQPGDGSITATVSIARYKDEMGDAKARSGDKRPTPNPPPTGPPPVKAMVIPKMSTDDVQWAYEMSEYAAPFKLDEKPASNVAYQMAPLRLQHLRAT